MKTGASTGPTIQWSELAWKGHACKHPMQIAVFVRGHREAVVDLPCATCTTANLHCVVEPTTFAAGKPDHSSSVPLYHLERKARPIFGGAGDLETLATRLGLPKFFWVLP